MKVMHKLWLLALIAMLAMALVTIAGACDDDDDDDDDTPADDDDDDDDDNDDDDDDDNDDDHTPGDCPPIDEDEATAFYWPGEPPSIQTMILSMEVGTTQIVAAAGVIAIHGLKVDQLQWSVMNPSDVDLGLHDLWIPEGAGLTAGDPDTYVGMIFGAAMTGTYDDFYVSVSGCATFNELGWVGDTFDGVLENVVFRPLLSDVTGEVDWSVGAGVGFNGIWTVSGTIIGAK